MFNIFLAEIATPASQVTTSLTGIVASLTEIVTSSIPVVAPLFALVVGIKMAPKILKWFHVG